MSSRLLQISINGYEQINGVEQSLYNLLETVVVRDINQVEIDVIEIDDADNEIDNCCKNKPSYGG